MPRTFQVSFIFPLGFVALLALGCKGKSNSIKPQQADIVESVYASATLKAKDQYQLYATVSGYLLNIGVSEGDIVSVNTLIARLDNSNPQLAAENARLAYDQSKNNNILLLELESQLATARKQHTLDSINLNRQAALWAQNVGTKNQLEQRQLAFDASKNQLKALQSRYSQQKLQLQTAILQAGNTYSMTEKSSGDFLVRSKIPGKVYALNYKVGDMVTPQKPIALLGSASEFILELTVDEVDISRIKLGQKVIIGMDAYKDQVYNGKISRIFPNLDPRTQSFLVEATFDKQPESLYPGMSAEVSIVIQEAKNALVIPLSYLTEKNTVFTTDGEKPVITGLKGLDKVQILKGLDTSNELLLPE
jgi:HlyD family secretion protein